MIPQEGLVVAVPSESVTRTVKRNRKEFERSAKSLQSDAQGLAQRVQDQVTNLV